MTTYATREEAMAAATARSAELADAWWDTVEFDGQNCADAWEEGKTCDGWDGNDRRCECGNRRVSWAFSEYPKGVWSYYAEAY